MTNNLFNEIPILTETIFFFTKIKCFKQNIGSVKIPVVYLQRFAVNPIVNIGQIYFYHLIIIF